MNFERVDTPIWGVESIGRVHFVICLTLVKISTDSWIHFPEFRCSRFLFFFMEEPNPPCQSSIHSLRRDCVHAQIFPQFMHDSWLMRTYKSINPIMSHAHPNLPPCSTLCFSLMSFRSSTNVSDWVYPKLNYEILSSDKCFRRNYTQYFRHVSPYFDLISSL